MQVGIYRAGSFSSQVAVAEEAACSQHLSAGWGMQANKGMIQQRNEQLISQCLFPNLVRLQQVLVTMAQCWDNSWAPLMSE